MKSIKKVVLTLVLVLLSTAWASGQSIYGDKVLYDVKMKYVNTLEEAMQRAKAEKKMIFFNCFADWALPCHAMNQHVFTDQAFCDYMNKTFVNLLIDVSTREQAELVEKYKIVFFAHFLILDADGNIVHRISGGSKLPDFKMKIQRALNPKTSLVGMDKEYENGNRNRDFLREYGQVLITAGESDKADQVLDLYVSKLKKTDMLKKENWFIVRRLSNGVGSEWFQFVVDNREVLAKNNGQKVINNYIAGGYSMLLMPYASDNKGYTAAKMDEIHKALTDCDISKDNNVYLYFELAKARGEKRYTDFINLLKNRVKEIDAVVVDNLEISVANITDASPEDLKEIVAFLTEKAEMSEGTIKKKFQALAASMNTKSGITFEKGTFAEALKKAKESNKLLFLDAYTSWCGPCQTMARQVFTQEGVGLFFDKNFVAIKIDMEKGEGIELAKKYEIKAYPTMMLLDGDGKVMHKIMGACGPAEFIRKLEVGLNPETCLGNVKAKYDRGDRTPALVCNYIQAMENAGDMRNGKAMAEEFFFSLSKTAQIKADVLPLLNIYANTPNDRLVTFLINNKPAYEKVFAQADLEQLFERIFFPVLLNQVRDPQATNEAKATIAQVKKLNMSNKSVLELFVRTAELYLQNNTDAVINIYTNEIAKMDTNPQGKLNLDMLLPTYMKEASAQQLQTIKQYVQEQTEKAHPRAKNGYIRLMSAF